MSSGAKLSAAVAEWKHGMDVDATMAHEALHKLWTRTEYPPGCKTEHKRWWNLVSNYLATRKDLEDFIDDGFGSQWDKKCAECGQRTMNVVRPGKAQCDNCG
ncbi:hypothetical protein LCGC14_2832800 [marine sediment metagenome]|uniref:SprT-like domain-containing protein n=1 Tax=marine sediment metagenome TaxID=412755 RepID=A0A0F9B4K0_9ZZZZ